MTDSIDDIVVVTPEGEPEVEYLAEIFLHNPRSNISQGHWVCLITQADGHSYYAMRSEMGAFTNRQLPLEIMRRMAEQLVLDGWQVVPRDNTDAQHASPVAH